MSKFLKSIQPSEVAFCRACRSHEKDQVSLFDDLRIANSLLFMIAKSSGQGRAEEKVTSLGAY
jgi:hypothetical protein